VIHANKDLGLKAKDMDPKAKDLGPKTETKAKELSRKAKDKDLYFGLKDQGQGLTSLTMGAIVRHSRQ